MPNTLYIKKIILGGSIPSFLLLQKAHVDLTFTVPVHSLYTAMNIHNRHLGKA